MAGTSKWLLLVLVLSTMDSMQLVSLPSEDSQGKTMPGTDSANECMACMLQDSPSCVCLLQCGVLAYVCIKEDFSPSMLAASMLPLS